MQSRSGQQKQQRQSYQPQYDSSRQARQHAPSSGNPPPKPFLKNPQLQVSHIDPRCAHESHYEQVEQDFPRASNGRCKLCFPTTESSDGGGDDAPPPSQTQSHHEVPVETGQRYSYLETPVEMQNPRFPRISPREPTIPQSPTTPPLPPQEHPHAVPEPPLPKFQDEKPPKEGSTSFYHVEPPPEPHPALFAPYAEPDTSVNSSTADYPPQPQYIVSPTAPRSQRQSQLQRRVTGEYEKPFVSPGIKHTPTYNPDSLISPNGLNPDNHQPGQITHPNMKTGDADWRHGLCNCSDLSVCCVGILCPCMIYGKTQHRLNQRSRKQDPTDLLGYKTCNGSCALMSMACGFQWLLTYIQHQRIRHMYDIKSGGVGADCVNSLCCYCCMLVQDENELKDREGQQRRFAGPASSAGATAYIPPDSMTYAPPPR